MSGRPNYGLDAPVWFYATLGAGVVAMGVAFVAPGGSLWRHAVWPGCVWLAYAVLHLWSSKIGKRRYVTKLLDRLEWRGDEMVLDVGCGHGLMLLEAAKRLDGGRAVGVDVWSGKDQWRNSPEATRENARRIGVAERIEIRDGDARSLPFEDGSFDVVLTSLVIHNIRDKAEQAQAVREMVRVMRPGGWLIILDIEGTRRYADELRRCGISDVRRSLSSPLFVPGTATVTARKPLA